MTNCQDGSILKEKAAARAGNYVSTYLSAAQWTALFDFAISQIISGVPVGTVGTNTMTQLIGIVTPGQMADATGFGVTLTMSMGLFTGITTFLSRTSTVVGNNLNAIFNQLQQRSKLMKSNGKTDQEIANQCYVMGLEFFTAKQLETIICRFKRQFKAAEWNKIYSGLTKFILIAKYNNNCPFI
uniref:ABC transmembrane type-1 domain-containing protein n=1 Tax=Rhabditophanes sp. KR3021 TaxID=114890 RepID=A0AC35U3S9_9BILA